MTPYFIDAELKVAHPLATQQFSTDGIDLFVEHYGALIQASQAERHQLELAIHTHIQRIKADCCITEFESITFFPLFIDI